MRSLYINKEQTPIGYYTPERTIALCDSPFCAEVCETGIIYRNEYQKNFMFQPPKRENGYSEGGYYDNGQFKSYGQVAPCVIEFKIVTLNPNGFFTNTTEMLGTYSGVLYSEASSATFSQSTFPDLNTSYYTKKWLIPFCKDKSYNITGLSHAIAYLHFNENDGFSFTNGDSRNIYLTADLYIGKLLEHGYAKTLSVRGLAGTIKYGVSSADTTFGASSGYYDSTVLCTGLQDLYLNTTTYNDGLFQNDSLFKITSKNCTNIDDYKLITTDSYYDQLSCTTPVNEEHSHYSSPIWKQSSYVDNSGYIYSYDLPSYYEIDVQVTGLLSNELNARHKLVRPVHYEYQGYSKTLHDIYNIGYPDYGSFSKEFAIYDYAPSGYQIIDSANPKYLREPFPENQSYYIKNALGISRIEMYFSYPTLASTGYIPFGLPYVIASVPSGNIFIDIYRHIGHNIYDSYADIYGSNVGNLLARYSGIYGLNDINDGYFFNKNIRCHNTYIYNESDLNPRIYMSGSYIDVLPNSPPSNPHHKCSTYILRTLNSNYGLCQQDTAPDAIMADLSSLTLDNGHVYNPVFSYVNVPEVGNPRPEVIAYHGKQADGIQERYETSPFTWTSDGITFYDSTEVHYTNCSGCSFEACVIVNNDKPTGTYLLRRGKTGASQDYCGDVACLFDNYDDMYYYKNPDYQSLCDWNYLVFRYTNNSPNVFAGLYVIYGIPEIDQNPSGCNISKGRACDSDGSIATWKGLRFEKQLSIDGSGVFGNDTVYYTNKCNDSHVLKSVVTNSSSFNYTHISGGYSTIYGCVVQFSGITSHPSVSYPYTYDSLVFYPSTPLKQHPEYISGDVTITPVYY